MNYWEIIFYADLTLYVLVSMTVLYMGIFAFASLYNRHGEIPRHKRENRFIVLIPAFKNGPATVRTVRAVLGQTYPQRQFDVTVISDKLDEMSNFRLAQQPITLLTPNFKKSARVKSLQLAINNLPQFKLYDVVIILNPGSYVEPDFLEKVNQAYEAAGTKAIQMHRLSQNHDTAPARLSAIFEEVNNSIFRRGHITLGLSAASAGSGMAFDFHWFKENIMNTTTTFDDKELEILLLRQHIYVDYFDDIMVFEEKFRQAADFNRQRRRWALSQVVTFIRGIRFLPEAILQRHYDLMDKIVQWMLLPRMIMMAVIVTMGMVMPFVYFTLAVKWWALFAIVLFIFALATPDYLVDDKWNKTFFMVPIILLSSVMSKTMIGKRIKKYVDQKL